MLKIFCILSLLIFGGCTTIERGARELLGISTSSVEQARPEAIKEIFRCDFNTCYEKSLQALTQLKTYIYAKKKAQKLIAVFVSEQDTTPVGVFFTELDPNNTQVEVASPSSYAKETIATQLFAQLTIALNPAQEKEVKPKNNIAKPK